MELIRASGLTYNNGSRDILTNADFRILAGEHCGLIGPNGAGKTTLLRLVFKEIEPESGSLVLREGLRIGYVPQSQEHVADISIGDFLTEENSVARARLEELETRMAAASPDAIEQLLARYENELTRFEAFGGYDCLDRGMHLLERLGLPNDHQQEMNTLSGGERSMVFFARALLGRPELLILDEPGNHLDYLGLAWLESFLADFKDSLLIVSHNRYLLDKTCTSILSLFQGQLESFSGNYSQYRSRVLHQAVLQRREFEQSQREQARLKKKIKQLQSIAMSQYNPPATVMSQLGAAKRKLAQEQARDCRRPQLAENGITPEIQGEESRSDIALKIRNYSLAFGEKLLLKDAGMEVLCGERVALVGPNGCGKSSLLRMLLDEGSWDHPRLKLGPGQKIGYLSQIPQFCPQAVSVEDEVRSWGSLTRDAAFGIISRMGFEYEDMDKSLKVLSGGETSRLQLARFLYECSNFLILDEPTNHMDIGAREAIEEALLDFNGTLLIVSHDRYFLDRLVNRVVEFRQYSLHSYPGNFSEYFANRYPVLPRMSGSVTRRGMERRQAVGDKQTTDPASAALEQRIMAAEAEKRRLERQVLVCLEKNDSANGRRYSRELEKTGVLIERLYEKWLAGG